LELFSGKFRDIWAKILRTPKNVPAPTPMPKMHGKLGCFWLPVE